MPQPAEVRVDVHEQMLDELDDAIGKLTFTTGPRGAVGPRTYREILACHDGTQGGRAVLAWAREIALRHGARVTVASVAPPPRAPPETPLGGAAYWRGMLEDQERRVQGLQDAADDGARTLRDAGVDAEAMTPIGSPTHELAVLTKRRGCDLVILGASPQGRFPVLGGTAAGVAGRVEASVLVARSSPPVRRILAATDGSDESAHGVATALSLASAWEADLIVQHVVEYAGDPGSVPPDGLLKEVVERLDLPQMPHVRYLVDVGRPADEIVARALKEACDLVVVGARGRGRVLAALLGSVSQRVANTASTSVLLARGG